MERRPEEPKVVKKTTRKIRDQVLLDEIDKALRDLFKSEGNDYQFVIFDPELLAKGVEIVGLYIKGGVYKFSDIVEDAVEEFGDVVKKMFNELKIAYGAYYIGASDEDAKKMDTSIRNLKYEDIIKSLNLKPMKKELGPIGKDWIEYIKEYEKGYFKKLARQGLLEKQALKEQEGYYKKVEEIKAWAKDNPYPPGGAEEVAKMFLFPELYP